MEATREVALCASDIESRGVSPAWETNVLEPARPFRPRQFEYSPLVPGRMVFGTLTGEVVVCDLPGRVIRHYRSGLSRRTSSIDAILGLCWFRKQPNLFVAGSSTGRLHLCDVDKEKPIKSFEQFDKLTSVHVNCVDDSLVVCGYEKHVRFYDLETGAIKLDLKNAHDHHINITRFSNKSPYLFATSSSDKTVKVAPNATKRNKRNKK